VGAEGIAGIRVADPHDLTVRRTEKKLLAVARPLGVEAAAGGNLPRAPGPGKGRTYTSGLPDSLE
jgi:hypothetical protein